MSASGDENERSYEVGYGLTPKHTRYKKGQKSANPKGRPKTAKGNYAELLRAELATTIEVTEGDRRKRITKADAAIKVLIKEALKGKLGAFDRMLRILPGLFELPPVARPNADDGFEAGGLSLSTLEALHRTIGHKISALKVAEETKAPGADGVPSPEGDTRKDESND